MVFSTDMIAPTAVGGDALDKGGKPRVGMLDTRTYQALEPLELPNKLRDRIAKAQRRAAAEKDGVSIFAANASASSSADAPHGEDTTTKAVEKQPLAAAGGGQRRESHILKRSESQPAMRTALPVVSAAKEKMHLPEVVLSHKMREFEAKMSVNALFVDPLENNLHHLSIEDKELVMAKMQTKIQAITAQVDAHFSILKDELDQNGIFDSAANAQRAQAICLVELQKKCKLEKIRDDAMKEVLGQEGTSGRGAMSQMEDKLDELLAKQQRTFREQQDHEALAMRRSLASSQMQRNTKSSNAKRRPAVPKKVLLQLSPVKRQHQHQHVGNQRFVSNQDDAGGDGMGTHRGRHADDPDQLLVVPSTAVAAVAVAAPEDWTSRHPHAAHVLQLLVANGGVSLPQPSAESSFDSNSSQARGAAVGDGTSGSLEDSPNGRGSTGRFLTQAEEWAERSPSYQTIARRVGQELLRRSTRQRWDSTGHFSGSYSGRGEGGGLAVLGLPVDLLQRLHRSQATPSARRSEEEERQREKQRELSNADKRSRVDAMYQQLRDKIQSKRHTANKVRATQSGNGLRASTASSRNGGKPSAATTKPTAPISGVSDSCPSQRNACTPESAAQTTTRGQHRTTRGSRMATSASAPVLGRIVQGDVSDPPLNGDVDPRVGVAVDTGRQSLLERKKLPGMMSQNKKKQSRGWRGDSLIGAPVSMDLTTLGHHSNARLEQRRNAAQTWTWHQPPRQDAKDKDSAASAVPEQDDDKYFDGDDDDDGDDSERRDTMGGVYEEEEDDDDDSAGDGDELENDRNSMTDDEDTSADGARSVRSVMSSRHPMDSARSVSKPTLKPPRPRKKKSHPSLTTGGGDPHQSPLGRNRSASIRGPRGSRLLSRTSNSSITSGSSGMFANIQFTANAQILQHRLEQIWKSLEFPFGSKLMMLEKYAESPNGDALATALVQWEAAVEIVLMREKLKHALAEFDEHHDLKASSRLTPAEWSYLLMQHVEIPLSAINLSPPAFVHWIQNHMDTVTSRCEKMAQQLKATTGEELLFQGHRYPSRG